MGKDFKKRIEKNILKDASTDFFRKCYDAKKMSSLMGNNIVSGGHMAPTYVWTYLK